MDTYFWTCYSPPTYSRNSWINGSLMCINGLLSLSVKADKRNYSVWTRICIYESRNGRTSIKFLLPDKTVFFLYCYVVSLPDSTLVVVHCKMILFVFVTPSVYSPRYAGAGNRIQNSAKVWRDHTPHVHLYGGNYKYASDDKEHYVLCFFFLNHANNSLIIKDNKGQITSV